MAPPERNSIHHSASLDRVAVVCLGAGSATLQVLAVREGIAASAGNENIVASLFGAWLLCTALGAAIGRFSVASRSTLAIALAAYGALVPLTVLAARAACRLIPLGTCPSLLVTTAGAFMLSGPSCALAGWIYARLARGTGDVGHSDRPAEGELSARAYLLETLGAGVTGLVLAVFLLDHVSSARVMALGAAAAFTGAVSVATSFGRALLAAVGFALCSALALLPVDRVSYGWQLPGHEVVDVQSSSRGALLRTKQRGQLQFVMQRAPLLVPSDHQAGELLGLLPPVLHANPSRVVFIGVPPGDAVAQMLKHRVERIDVVVGDDRVAAMVRTYAPGANDARVSVVAGDERQWARETPAASHDLVVIHAGVPSAISAGRLFSLEMYQSLRTRLRTGGMVVVVLPGYGAQASVEQRRFYSSVAASLRSAFPHVLPLPADSMLLVGSVAASLERPHVAGTLRARLAARGLAPVFVHETWIEDALADARVADAVLWTSYAEAASTDRRPTAVHAALRATMTELDEAGLRVPWLLGGLMLVAVLVWATPWSRPFSFAIATTGMAGLALQLVLMLVYQTAVAALYRDVSLVTAAFMLASCVAAWWTSKAAATRARVLGWEALQAALAVALALAVPALASSQQLHARMAVSAAAALVGASTGAQIALISRLPGAFAGGVGGALYAVDLLGASLAAALVYTVLVPAHGLVGTAWLVAAAKSASLLSLASRRHRVPVASATSAVPLPVIAWVAAVAIMLEPSFARVLRAWTLDRVYTIAVLLVLGAVLLAAFTPNVLRARIVSVRRRLQPITRRILISPTRLLSFVLLLPLAALPVARCYFIIPFLFCHVCPRPCVFGVMRPYVVTTALLSNVGDRRFCQHTCPVAHVQSAASRVGIRRHRTGRAVWGLRLVLLLVVAVAYMQVRLNFRGGSSGVSLYSAVYLNDYAICASVLVSAGLLLALSFVVRRPFCEGVCPIGAASELLGRVEKRWVLRGQARGSNERL